MDAFSGCSSLASITLPESVTSIPSGAFENCSSLASIVLPKSLVSIGPGTFRGCSSLTSITIPEGVTSICVATFSGCSSLTSITIPNSVTSIAGHAFSGCNSLTSITIPNSETSIEESAFYGCSSLTSITIPEGVTSIKNFAFSGCSSLTSIEIPSSVTSIGYSVFSGCSSLTSVTIPNSVTSIGHSVFYGCSSLTSITIPNSVTSIAGHVFSGCSSLTSITIPNSVTSIGDCAFDGCRNLTSITIPEGVTSIGGRAFSDCSSLTSITIPEGVTSIGNNAFSACQKLDTVTSLATTAPALSGTSVFILTPSDKILRYPYGSDYSAWEPYFAKSEPFYTTIAEGKCGDNLTWALTSDSTLTINGTGAMPNYTSTTMPWKDYLTTIKKVVVEEGVTSLGNYAFRSCSSLVEATLGESIATIGTYAFSHCTALEKVNIPASVSTIGNFAFYNCNKLQEIIFPEGLATIGQYAFYQCKSLTDVTLLATTAPTLGDKVFTQIPSTATLYCQYGGDYSAWEPYFATISYTDVVDSGSCSTNLTWVLTNDSTLIISGNGAMGNFTSASSPWKDHLTAIKKVVVEEGVTSLGNYAFRGCSSLVEATLAESVTTLGTYLFSHCTSLEKVNIPEGVTTLGNYAFYNCNKMQEITLPASLTNIGTYALSNCSSIEKITSNATTAPALASNALRNIPATAALHLPTGAAKSYKAAAGWSLFTNIISPCPISLTINDEAMGSATLSEETPNYGSSVTVQITPAENHKLKAITVNGTDVTVDVVDGIYTIKNIEDATEIYVELEKSDYCAITLDDVTATFGAMVDLPIAMVNTYGITALQMDITLPEGVTPVTDDDGAIIATLNPERATASHTITASQMENDIVKMVIFSSDNTPLNGDNGTIATLKVRAMPTETTEPGTITIDNILGVTPNARAIKIAGTTATLNIQLLTFIPGDANMSGTVTVSDIVATINQMFGKTQAAFSFDAADMNGDGEISIVDVVNIVNTIITAPDNSGSARARIRAAANGESIRSEVSADGDNTLMSLSLNGSAAYTAMQMDVELPEGATLVAATSGDESHTIAWNRLDNGTVRIVVYSLSSATFDGETLLTLEVENANGTISVDNVSVATPAGSETSIGGTSADVNGTTGIGGTAEEIVSVRYFNEAGAELDEPQKGINIVVTEYAGGRIESKKVLKK